eukprot:gb/GEZN01007330.1/.p1 GENE.gb/GEZN01007330.1/~~gb/GEZN01007330.1/.p1  ORF type:complete len:324 (+),score=53.37 gb/GEZN01007330.1/:144-974(+)
MLRPQAPPPPVTSDDPPPDDFTIFKPKMKQEIVEATSPDVRRGQKFSPEDSMEEPLRLAKLFKNKAYERMRLKFLRNIQVFASDEFRVKATARTFLDATELDHTPVLHAEESVLEYLDDIPEKAKNRIDLAKRQIHSLVTASTNPLDTILAEEHKTHKSRITSTASSPQGKASHGRYSFPPDVSSLGSSQQSAISPLASPNVLSPLGSAVPPSQDFATFTSPPSVSKTIHHRSESMKLLAEATTFPNNIQQSDQMTVCLRATETLTVLPVISTPTR